MFSRHNANVWLTYYDSNADKLFRNAKRNAAQRCASASFASNDYNAN